MVARFVAAALLLLGVAYILDPDDLRDVLPGNVQAAEVEPATFVGSETCAGCHRVESDLWRGSHHRSAMAHASDTSVRGDFGEAGFEYYGLRTRFFRQDGKFMVETDGPDGKLAAFEVKYTFGIDPLQQYLVEFADGRLQVLPFAWDARPKIAGGQRWFHMYGAEHIEAGDELHWTKPSQNWNFMCADCHSTNVKKNYDPATKRYSTSWSEIHVGCESCHGAGSRHIAWAGAAREKSAPLYGSKGFAILFDERTEINWLWDEVSRKPHRSRPRSTAKEEQVCAQCHSRRAQIAEGYAPGDNFHDFYRISLPLEPLYFSDGHQKEEVFVSGSFALSKMHAKGVTCSDCHEPHSGKLRAEGDAVCTQCHLPDRYATAGHHFHQQSSEAARCVSCHMPARTYMTVDDRRDHSFQVPRPELTVRFGIPNACNQCHVEKPAQWADEAVRSWQGTTPHGFQNFAEAFAMADTGRPQARDFLLSVLADKEAPDLARAAAAADLARYPEPAVAEALARSLSDDNPVVRRSSVASLQNVPLQLRVRWLAPLLADPVRTVRNEAVVALADAPAGLLDRGASSPFARAAREYEETQRLHADRAEFRTNFGSFLARSGRASDAETELRAAIELDRQYIPAYVNLAQLLRTLRGELDAERVLREGLKNVPRDASLHHALGLSLVRLRRNVLALDELAAAVDLAPRNMRFAYVYAIALNSQNRPDYALRQLERAHDIDPGDQPILEALISINRELRQRPQALRYAEKLRLLRPDDPTLESLLRELRQSP